MKSRIYLEDLESEGKISTQDSNLVRSAIKKGSLFFVVGQSGSGKSVVSRILANEIAKETKRLVNVYLDDLELKYADKLVHNGFLKDEGVIWKEHDELKSENWDFTQHSVMIDEVWKGITKSGWLLARCQNIENIILSNQLHRTTSKIINDNQALEIIIESFNIEPDIDYQDILSWLRDRGTVFIYLSNNKEKIFSPQLYFLTEKID